MRIRGCLIALSIAAGAGLTAAAANNFGDDEVIVAVIDSGVRATHQEFDYRGPDSTDDQFVAWWDFTNELVDPLVPAAGQLWDPRARDPIDTVGHGTATASLAVGLNRVAASKKAKSYAPGYKLAVARVCASSSCGGNVPAAIRWAVQTVNADLITMSIGSQVPAPEVILGISKEAKAAREAGVLFVVANGNGIGYSGLAPDPGWATPNGSSPYVLGVGADDDIFRWGVTTDPEVTAPYSLVPQASNVCDSCYTAASGTSFGAPVVAGMAAAAIAEAVANGASSTPDQMERLLKYAAVDDPLIPPTFEGYGALDGSRMPLILQHAAAGSLPPRPDPDPTAVYMEQIIMPLRTIWSDDLGAGAGRFEPVPPDVASPANPPGALQAGVMAGIVEGETYTFTMSAGESATFTVPLDEGEGGFEMLLYRGAGPSFLATDLIARSGFRYEQDMLLSYRASTAGTFTILIVGWSQPFLLATPYEFVTSSSDPATPEASFTAQSYYATTATFLGYE